MADALSQILDATAAASILLTVYHLGRRRPGRAKHSPASKRSSSKPC